jgi:hypothetical protein
MYARAIAAKLLHERLEGNLELVAKRDKRDLAALGFAEIAESHRNRVKNNIHADKLILEAETRVLMHKRKKSVVCARATAPSFT